MAKIRSFGAKLYLNGIAVGGLTDIAATGTEVSIIDTTSHDSSGGYRTFLSGLKDGGTLEVTGRYNYADSGQAEWKAEAGVLHAFYIILADNSGLAFNAIVGGFQTSNPLDDAVEFTATAKITGLVYPVFPTITVTGITTPAASDPIVMTMGVGFISGKPTWVFGSDWAVAWSGTSWDVFDESATYLATKISTALIPNGLTSFTITTGAGQPTLTPS